MIPRVERHRLFWHHAAVLPPYPSPDERDAAFARLCARAGAERVEYGRSVEGRPLVAYRIPARTEPAPRVLCAANLHGVEWVTGRVAEGFFDAIAAGSGSAGALRDRSEVWIAPCLNPDGYARTFEREGRGRPSELRTNARGVDLNRNFPIPPGARRSRIPFGGTARPGRSTYRGPAPLSEPETAALDGLFTARPFHAVASLHSFMGRLLPATVADPRDFETYAALCRAFASAQPRSRYGRLASRRVRLVVGRLEDHAHHAHRAWSVCVETFPIVASLRQHLRAPSLFWRFNPRDPGSWVANDVPGLAAFFLAALDRPRPGAAA